MAAVASALSQLGVGKESSKLTAVAPSIWIPFSGSLDVQDKVAKLPDEGIRGSAVQTYGMTEGPKYSEIGWSGAVFPDSLGYLLASLLGEVATTGASAPYTHAINIKNSADAQGPALSVTDFYGGTWTNPARRFAGCQVAELGLKWNADGKLEYSVKLVGAASAVAAKPSASWTSVPETPTWVGTTTIGGAAKTYCEMGEVTLKRNTTAQMNVDGTQGPYGIFAGPLQVTGKMTLIHEDDTELTRYLTGAETTLAIDFTQGAAAALTQVLLTMSKVEYTEGKKVTGKDWVETEIGFEACANTTDVGASAGFSPIKVTLQNAIASGVYV